MVASGPGDPPTRAPVASGGPAPASLLPGRGRLIPPTAGPPGSTPAPPRPGFAPRSPPEAQQLSRAPRRTGAGSGPRVLDPQKEAGTFQTRAGTGEGTQGLRGQRRRGAPTLPGQGQRGARGPGAGAHRASPCDAACAAGRCRPTRSRCGPRCCPWRARERVGDRGTARLRSTCRCVPGARDKFAAPRRAGTRGAGTRGRGLQGRGQVHPGTARPQAVPPSVCRRPRGSGTAQAWARSQWLWDPLPPAWGNGTVSAQPARVPGRRVVRGHPGALPRPPCGACPGEASWIIETALHLSAGAPRVPATPVPRASW